ncbi:hypothetical protein [Halococcoides cellulosivorans]|uniref:hypothetical protein n=1 Tax=Halococcoides cellulosivorans TaxID=1679096 RepID=UPI00131EDBBA|nr:hypothetical protein [Halococcoides cellulosivorans]
MGTKYQIFLDVCNYIWWTSLVFILCISVILGLITDRGVLVYALFAYLFLSPILFPIVLILKWFPRGNPNPWKNAEGEYRFSEDRGADEADNVDESSANSEEGETDGSDESQYGADFDA